MKYLFIPLLILFASNSQAQSDTAKSGNPIIKGWYADPEAAIFKKKYWVFPTYSDK